MLLTMANCVECPRSKKRRLKRDKLSSVHIEAAITQVGRIKETSEYKQDDGV